MNINAPTFMLDTVVGAASGKKLSLRDWLAQWACDANRIVYVGTDSQQSAGVTKFTTAIVSYEPGKGGTYAFIRYKTRRIDSLRERLLTEAWKSVELALLVAQNTPELKIVVHLDVNESVKYKSGKYAGDLIALVVGQGFKAEIKPNAFAASTLADSLVKGY